MRRKGAITVALHGFAVRRHDPRLFQRTSKIQIPRRCAKVDLLRRFLQRVLPRRIKESVLHRNVIKIGFGLLLLLLSRANLLQPSAHHLQVPLRVGVVRLAAQRLQELLFALLPALLVAAAAVLLVAVGAFVAFGAYQERKALQQGHMLGQQERSPWAESLPYYDPEPQREPRKPGVIARWREERQRKRDAEQAARKAAMRERLDEVLKKVSEVGGVNNLSPEERRFLEEASAELRKERSN